MRLAGTMERCTDKAQMMIQNGIGEGELAGGCVITTYMFKIDDVDTTLCITSFLDKSFR